MTLVLKPKGRGNWRAIVMVVQGDLLPTVRGREVKVGQVVALAGLVLRICEVRP